MSSFIDYEEDSDLERVKKFFLKIYTITRIIEKGTAIFLLLMILIMVIVLLIPNGNELIGNFFKALSNLFKIN